MRTVLAAILVLWSGAAFAGDPVKGVWKTMPGDDGAYGYVDIKPCGDRMCGTLTQAFDATGAAAASDNIGKRIVWDMLALGGGSYDSGQVWAPDRDTTYSAKMQLTGRSLAVSGCVLGGLICRAQDWSRVE